MTMRFVAASVIPDGARLRRVVADTGRLAVDSGRLAVDAGRLAAAPVLVVGRTAVVVGVPLAGHAAGSAVGVAGSAISGATGAATTVASTAAGAATTAAGAASGAALSAARPVASAATGTAASAAATATSATTHAATKVASAATGAATGAAKRAARPVASAASGAAKTAAKSAIRPVASAATAAATRATTAAGSAAASSATAAGSVAASAAKRAARPVASAASGAARTAAKSAIRPVASAATAAATRTATAASSATATAAKRAARPVTSAASAAASRTAHLATHLTTTLATDLAHHTPRRAVRRVWSTHGRAHVEVRGMTGHGPRHRALARGVTTALRRVEGVRWAEVNAVTQQVLVAFDDDQVDVGDLVEIVEAVEEEHGTADAPFSRLGPDHPAADAPVRLAAAALATDLAGLTAATFARLLRVPSLPVAARAPLLFAEAPRVRNALRAHLGDVHAELLLSVAGSVIHTLTQGPAPLAVDSLHHALQLVEARARRTVWSRREPHLVGDGAMLRQEARRHPPRPAPLPDGPVEKLGDRTALAALLGAGGVLAATGDPARAAELMAATMPRAARQGREAFAAVLGRELARRGVVAMDAGALRRLDRISVVVVDSSALGTGRPRILDAAALSPGVTDAEMWRLAQKALAASDAARPSAGPIAAAGPSASANSSATATASGPTATARTRPDLAADCPWQAGPWRFDHAPDASRGRLGGPVALTLDVRHSHDPRGGPHGRVRVGVDVDPRAEALLAAARGAGVRLAITAHDSAGDLAAWADEVIAGHEVLAEHVRSLQADGHGVLVVSAADDEALAAADVGVAVTRPGGPVCWSADLLCGPDLTEVWRVLRSLGTAHAVSHQAARLAVGGSALGALLAVTGRRRRMGPQNVPPIHGAALLAVLDGAYSGFRIGSLTPPPPAIRANWHDLTAEESFERLERGVGSPPPAEPPRGRLVTAVRAARTRAETMVRTSAISGIITPPLGNTAALSRAVLRELRDPLTPVLVFGAAASAVVGSGVDAVLVGGVVAGNALVGGAQRLRAERALRRLLLGEKVRARRVSRRPEDGAAPRRWQDVASAKSTAADPEPIPADELRPGDVVRVEVGDVVPADLRLLDADGLEADESSLTGESLPVDKSAEATPGAELDERSCMLYEGCTVLTGTALGLVVAVGRDTEAGRAAAVAGTAAPSAGLQARLAGLTRTALPAAGVGGLTVAVVSALRGVPFRAAVASGVAVGVAAVPEGLPLVATVAQLAAARRLAPRGILVRSSRTLEALGRVDTVCFDKTGTLTRGRLSVTAVADVEGGVPPGGAVGRRVLKTAARACPDPGDEGAASVLHATDRAVLDAAHERLGHDVDWTLRADLPFETNRGFSASLGSNSPKVVLAVKGAPEVVLALCSKVRDRHGKRRKLSGQQRRAAEEAVTRMAGDGLRVLAVAEKRPQTLPEPDPDLAAMAEDLTLLGFVGIADTPRADADEAVARLAEAGVKVTMITGDHPETATAIARDLGIPDAHLVMTGAEFDQLPERPRIERVAATTVFARVSPQQKVKIVRALQKAGRVVAMTGDGSNDAAAIRAADVGIALAGHGSAAARSAADLVLAEPDPVRIADALAEGRALWDRVRDAASILVGGNAGEVAFTVLGTAVGGRNPLNTRQLLLVNMLTDMMPALAVALAPAKAATNGGAGNGVHDDDGAHRDNGAHDGEGGARTMPRPTDDTWDPVLVRGLAIRGAATAAGAMLAWVFGRATGRRGRAGTMALAALVGTQLGQTLATGRHSALVAVTTAASALALFAVIQTPGVSHFFGCTPLGPVAWAAVAGASAAATMAAVAAPALLDRFGLGMPGAVAGAAA